MRLHSLFWVQQIAHTFEVDLDVGNLDSKLDVLVRLVDALENAMDRARDNTLLNRVLH